MVYVIQQKNDGPIKIGESTSLVSRMTVLKQGNPYSFNFLAAVDGNTDLESALHQRFDRYKIRGEWFHPCREILNYISNVQGNNVIIAGYEVRVGENINVAEIQRAIRALDANGR